MPIAHNIGLAPYPAPISSAFYVYNCIRLGQAAAYGPKLPLVVGLIIARLLLPQTSHRWHRAA